MKMRKKGVLALVLVCGLLLQPFAGMQSVQAAEPEKVFQVKTKAIKVAG